MFESIAIPHNTLVLFGSCGIVLSSKMFIIQEIASALIAGVVVVIVDWKNSAPRHSAKSIAHCRMHLPKKLHGGLRCATRHSIPLHASNSTLNSAASLPLCHSASGTPLALSPAICSAKSIAPCRMHLQKKLLKKL